MYKIIINNDKSIDTLKEFFEVLDKLGFEKCYYLPSYQIPDEYKDSLKVEDKDFHEFKCEGNLFKKSNNVKFIWEHENLYEKYDLFKNLISGSAIPFKKYRQLFPDELICEIEKAGFVEIQGDMLKLDYRFISSPAGNVICDSVNHKTSEAIHIGVDSIYFTNFLLKHPIDCENVLELGCGTGIHSLFLVKNTKATLVDINNRALACTRLNRLINSRNDKNITYVKSDWFTDLNKEPFSCIIANPPFEWRTGTDKRSSTVATFGGADFGLENTLSILNEAHEYLMERGKIFILTQTPVTISGEIVITEFLDELDFGIVNIHVLYTYYCCSQNMHHDMKQNNISHFAMIVIEAVSGSGIKDVTISDNRSLTKKNADTLRIEATRKYWENINV